MCVVATAADWIAEQRSEHRTFTGGAAWVTRGRQAGEPLPGSRGLIALPPCTRIVGLAEGLAPSSHRSARLPGGDCPRARSARARTALRHFVSGWRTPADEVVRSAPSLFGPPLRGRPNPR